MLFGNESLFEFFVLYVLGGLLFLPFSIYLAVDNNKKLKSEDQEVSSFLWGYFIGWQLIIGTCSQLLIVSSLLAKNLTNISQGALIFSLVFILVQFPFAFGYLKRRKSWMIIHTVICFNMFLWLVNGIYLSKRWNEFDKKTESKSSYKFIPITLSVLGGVWMIISLIFFSIVLYSETGLLKTKNKKPSELTLEYDYSVDESKASKNSYSNIARYYEEQYISEKKQEKNAKSANNKIKIDAKENNYNLKMFNGSPSFNCFAKLSNIESLICGSEELSQLDFEAAYYYEFLDGKIDPFVLKTSQLNWIKENQRPCDNNPTKETKELCLRHETNIRKKSLKTWSEVMSYGSVMLDEALIIFNDNDISCKYRSTNHEIRDCLSHQLRFLEQTIKLYLIKGESKLDAAHIEKLKVNQEIWEDYVNGVCKLSGVAYSEGSSRGVFNLNCYLDEYEVRLNRLWSGFISPTFNSLDGGVPNIVYSKELRAGK